MEFVYTHICHDTFVANNFLTPNMNNVRVVTFDNVGATVALAYKLPLVYECM